MLLTVQDIPDIGKASQQNHPQLASKSTPAHPGQLQQRTQLHLHIPSNPYNSIKRSQSCTSQEDSNCSTISRSTVHTTGHIRDRSVADFYDTASTATTITPTPSESGKDALTYQQHTYGVRAPQHHHHHHHQPHTSQHASGLAQPTNEQREHELIMALQNQSFDYPQSLRTISSQSQASNDPKSGTNKSISFSVTSEEDESIPYHAREDSRPFTYGDPTGVQLSPTPNRKGTGMLKLQAGLSSPSLVRKHLGANSGNSTPSQRKSPSSGRNDFEEMLLQRREQILNDKYSIGDKTPNGNGVTENSATTANAPNKWNTNSGALNGSYHEPLKRSNTMDGFSRASGYVSDG